MGNSGYRKVLCVRCSRCSGRGLGRGRRHEEMFSGFVDFPIDFFHTRFPPIVVPATPPRPLIGRHRGSAYGHYFLPPNSWTGSSRRSGEEETKLKKKKNAFGAISCRCFCRIRERLGGFKQIFSARAVVDVVGEWVWVDSYIIWRCKSGSKKLGVGESGVGGWTSGREKRDRGAGAPVT